MQANLTITITLLACMSLSSCGGGSGGSPAPNPPANDPPAMDPPAMDPPTEPQVTTQLVFTSLPAFAQPLAMLQAPGDDDNWYIVERAGRVLRFANDPNASATEAFIDIASIVESGPGEAGLLGMAFHPDYQNNGEVFLSYTRPGLVSYVSRFTSLDNGETLDPATEEVLITVLQDFTNHNGGHIAFGPDGFLYIGMGDGGSGNDPNDRAQDTTNLMGALLRIDVDSGSPFAIPPSNPFRGNSPCTQGFGGAACPELFAWGLRNPWRWSFDRDTGDIWAGDVGQDNREEINLIRLGENYGWRIRDGTNCNAVLNINCDPTGLVDPVFEYSHSLGFSVTGGYVYRGSAISNLNGVYVFGDFGTGRIWGTAADGESGFTTTELLNTTLSIASFAEANDGELYVLNYGSGRIFQLVEQ